MDLESVKQELQQLEDLYQNGFIPQDEYNIRKEKLVVQLPSEDINSQVVDATEENLNEDVNTTEGKVTIDSGESSQEEDGFEPDEVTESVNEIEDIQDMSSFTELSAMEKLKHKMMEQGTPATTGM